MKYKRKSFLIMGMILCMLLSACSGQMPVQTSDGGATKEETKNEQGTTQIFAGFLQELEELANKQEQTISLDGVPEFSGDAYVILNDNQPSFEEEDFTTTAFEEYGNLDALGRCSVAYANIGTELMPTEERGRISQIKPTGWQSVTYDFVDGRYLYNRCHLIGYQLTAENANDRNLITGTRFMNTEGMLPFENMVADYIKETGNHVLYRVTPVFEGQNLVASGVVMEAESVEDKGEGICFHVYVYNNQPGVSIDYATGNSTLANEEIKEEAKESQEGQTYILNTGSKKIHLPSCSGVEDMKAENKKEYTGSKEELLEQGYEACKRCNP